LFLSAAVGAEGHVFLYEPRPVMHQILRQNLGANEIRNVTLMRRALGRVRQVESAGAAETIDELRLTRLDWLKVMDAAVALDVLEGAEETLWRLRPCLFLAAMDSEHLAQLAEHAQGHSYRCWKLEITLYDVGNFNRRDADIFDGRTALAMLAIPEEVGVEVDLQPCVEMS
jgi:hypothetical protein